MSHSHNFTKTLAVTSVITTEQSAVILNNVHCQVLCDNHDSGCAKYNGGVWDYAMAYFDQANAAAEWNGRFFNKTNRFTQNESIRESECSAIKASLNISFSRMPNLNKILIK